VTETKVTIIKYGFEPTAVTKQPVDFPPDAQARVDRFVDTVDERLGSSEPTAEVVQATLARLHGDGDLLDRYREEASVSPVERLRLDAYDPRTVTLKADHWADTDEERARQSRPLRWLWAGFDASPLANNLALALPFRRMLADHLFDAVGDDVQLFRWIRFPYGHGIELGDRSVVHRGVLLDDRGRLEIGDRVSIAEGATLHSHSHDLVDQTDVSLYRTVVADDARIASDAMIGAGCLVGRNAMVGAKAVVRGDVPAHHVAVGTPAEGVAVKPGWESVAADPGRLEDNRPSRRIEYDVPADVDHVDEFGRDLSPPDADGP
jgi:maltose O-acetyltransferase